MGITPSNRDKKPFLLLVGGRIKVGVNILRSPSSTPFSPAFAEAASRRQAPGEREMAVIF